MEYYNFYKFFNFAFKSNLNILVASPILFEVKINNEKKESSIEYNLNDLFLYKNKFKKKCFIKNINDVDVYISSSIKDEDLTKYDNKEIILNEKNEQILILKNVENFNYIKIVYKYYIKMMPKLNKIQIPNFFKDIHILKHNQNKKL
ncbi:MAG: hypothetical protein U1E31_01685 [Rickettsiales bacterium]